MIDSMGFKPGDYVESKRSVDDEYTVGQRYMDHAGWDGNGSRTVAGRGTVNTQARPNIPVTITKKARLAVAVPVLDQRDDGKRDLILQTTEDNLVEFILGTVSFKAELDVVIAYLEALR